MLIQFVYYLGLCEKNDLQVKGKFSNPIFTYVPFLKWFMPQFDLKCYAKKHGIGLK